MKDEARKDEVTAARESMHVELRLQARYALRTTEDPAAIRRHRIPQAS